ncbi:MAG: hypothetical protein NW206_17335 [Hyphomonadaceae bacterium]|nr:hypothetical protein [Hyphomonadaceae bacterium]
MTAPDHEFDDDAFVGNTSPEMADAYRRLRKDQRIESIIAQLRHRGVPEREILILYRSAACAADAGWNSGQHESSVTIDARRDLARRLKQWIDDAAHDAEFAAVQVELGGVIYDRAPAAKDDLGDTRAQVCERAPLLEILGDIASSIDQGASIDDPPGAPRRRGVSQRNFVLLELFDLLQLYFPGRAPNQEAETFASVVLDAEIPHGTITRLRKDDCRRYTRDEQ